MEAVKIFIFWHTSSADHSARHCCVLIQGCNAQPGVQLSFQFPRAASSPRPGTGLGLVTWLWADHRGAPDEMGAFWGALSKRLPPEEGYQLPTMMVAAAELTLPLLLLWVNVRLSLCLQCYLPLDRNGSSTKSPCLRSCCVCRGTSLWQNTWGCLLARAPEPLIIRSVGKMFPRGDNW